MVKKLVCFAIVFLMTFGMCGCWDGARPFVIDLEYEESAYDINNVTLEFFYGVKKAFIKEGLDDTRQYIYGDAHVFFTKTTNFVNYILDEDTGSESFDYSSSDIFLVKTILREKFFSDDYLQDNNRGTPIFFNHSEMITVPQELFTENTGTIYFYLRIDCRVNGGQDDSINFISFDYKLEGDKVFITSVNFNR